MIGPVSRLVVLALVLASFCPGNCSIALPCQMQCKAPCYESGVRILGELEPEASISPSSALLPPTAATDQPAAHQTQDEPMSRLLERVTAVAESKALAATQVSATCCALQQQHSCMQGLPLQDTAVCRPLSHRSCSIGFHGNFCPY
jgi:hypothetical protein